MVDNKLINIRDCYDLLKWENEFAAGCSLFIRLKDLLDKEVVYYKGLFEGPQKLLNSKIVFFKNEEVKQLQCKYRIEAAENYTELLKPLFTEYFAENWHQSMLICKNFGDHIVFSIPELNKLIGYEVLNDLDPFTQVIELTGEEAVVEEAV